MSSVAFVDMVAQQREVGAEVEAAVLAVLGRTDWVLGHEVNQFEEEFAAFCGVAGAVGTDSGLSALELGLRAVGVRAGDEVIIPGNTFIATALAVSSIGATPVLVDVDPQTYTITHDAVEAAITDATRAVVPVHLYGQPADMDALSAVARRHGLAVVEDACQAHGARDRGRRAGSLGDAAAFSFYPSKNLGAYGDGGMLVASDPAVLDEVRLLRNYGQREKYCHERRGFNRRLDTLQAAALRVKLPHLDRWNAARAEAAAWYAEALTSIGIEPPTVRADVEHVWHLHVVHVERRDEILRDLRVGGIECGVHYPVPIHQQPAYRDLDLPHRLDVVDEQAPSLLSLPMHPYLAASQLEAVVECLQLALGRVGALAP